MAKMSKEEERKLIEKNKPKFKFDFNSDSDENEQNQGPMSDTMTRT